MVHPFRVGLGTAGYETEDECTASVLAAIEIGYRHLDTAQLYGSESAIGDALSDAAVSEGDVWIATKVHPKHMGPGDVVPSVIDSRERLGVDVIDLLYVHWPLGAYDPDVTLPAFDELQEEGVVRHVGVSNFTVPMLEKARSTLSTPIFAHQVEMHPLLQQTKLLEHAQDHDNWLVAYSPFARGHALDVPEIRDIASKHEVSPAQVCLSWLLGKDNVSVIPKATGRRHLRENYGSVSLSLDRADVELIESIEQTKRVMTPEISSILDEYGTHPQTQSER